MPHKRKLEHSYPSGKRRLIVAKELPRYETPEGHAHIYVFGKRYRIPVLLDSGSNIFLINERIVQDLNIPFETRTDAIQIHGFTGEAISSGGSHYTHPIYLEIGTNHHLSLVSCEIAPAGKYGMIIPLEWNKEHPITNLDEPTTWSFHHEKC